MRVLVWQSYGEARVFRLETLQDYGHVLGKIATSTEGWSDEFQEKLAQSATFIVRAMNKGRTDQAERELLSLERALFRGSEAFETFQITNLQSF